MEKWLIFVLTCLTYTSFVGETGSFAGIKSSLKNDVGVNESLLGIVDAVGYLGRFIGGIYMFLTPLKEPKYKFFLACCVQMFFVGTIHLLIESFGDYKIAMIIIARFAIGLSRAYMIMPYLILTHYYDPNNQEQKSKIHSWHALTNLGQVLFLIFVQYTIQEEIISWNISFTVTIAIIFILGSFQQYYVPEIEMTSEEHEDSLQYIRQVKAQLKVFFQETPNCLWLIDAIFTQIIYLIIFLWIPFYFTQVGFGVNSSLISIMFPLIMTFSIILFEQFIPCLQNKINIIIGAFYFLIMAIFVLLYFLQAFKQLISVYFILIGSIGALLAPGYTRTISTDPVILTQGDERKKFLVISFFKLLRQPVFIIFLILTGFFVQKNVKNMFLIFFVIQLIIFVCNTWRKCFVEGQEKSIIQETQEIQ